ncbi:MAG TPA: GNAT family N-acetyltransferase [Flavisolibacter sp.]
MHPHIQYLEQKSIDRSRWDECIGRSPNGLVYAYSFYLDALADNWDALVLNDYEAVMPLPWRKKYGVQYIYQPLFAAQLGLFGNNLSAQLLNDFFKAVPKKFRYWDFTLNHANVFALDRYPMQLRSNYVLSLEKDHSSLHSAYRENIRRNIKKALSYGCTTSTGIPVKDIINLTLQFSADRSVDPQSLRRFEGLYETLDQQELAKTYGVLSKEGQLLSSCVFFFSHKRAYYILVGNHPNGRTLGASHLLIDAFIKDHASQPLLLDFEGSDLRNLAFFYSSFGAVEEKYASIKLNRLPWFLKWMKR